MLSGSAHKPFVYRQLVPSLIRSVTAVTPAPLKERISANFGAKYEELIVLFEWNRSHLYEHILSLILTFVCFVALAFALRSSIGVFYSFPSFVNDVAPVIGLLILPVFFRYINYVYDPATLVFFTLALVSLYKRERWWFYVLFVLATLNKETSILLIGLFLLREGRLVSAVQTAAHGLAQLAIWGSVRLFLVVTYAANPGSSMEFHLIDHNLVDCYRN